MVEIVSEDTNTNLEYLVQKDEYTTVSEQRELAGGYEVALARQSYTIGIRGHGEGIIRKKGKFTVKNLKRVIFKKGEEREAIKLFVDINKEILISKYSFKQKSSFYPRPLFQYYIEYLINGKLDDNIPPMQEYAIKRSKRLTKNVKFCQYMRDRCPELLKNPESILHDCEFLNKFYYNKVNEENEDIETETEKQKDSRNRNRNR